MERSISEEVCIGDGVVRNSDVSADVKQMQKHKIDVCNGE